MVAHRRRRPRGVVFLVVLLAVVGAWWGWSPQNRQTTGEVLADLAAGAGMPGISGRVSADGTVLPPVGLEESPSRIAPAVLPPAFSDRYVFKSPGASPTSPNGWSPCRPIHYVVDTTGAPGTFGPTVRSAIAEIAAHTGLTFADDGDVLEAADEDRAAQVPTAYPDRWAPVLIRFADETSVPGLAGTRVGLAGTTAMSSPSTDKDHFVSGFVYLDTELLAMPGIGGAPAYLPVLRHELGHLVGLDHIEDPNQIMFAQTGFAIDFQPGDLTGLALLGQASCAPDL